jgi:hypothetical protein
MEIRRRRLEKFGKKDEDPQQEWSRYKKKTSLFCYKRSNFLFPMFVLLKFGFIGYFIFLSESLELFKSKIKLCCDTAPSLLHLSKLGVTYQTKEYVVSWYQGLSN